MTAFLDLVVNDCGEPILPPIDNPEGRKAFFREFFKTGAGKRLAQVGVSAEAERRIGEICLKWYGEDPEITFDRLARVVETLIDTIDPALFPPAPEQAPVAEDTRPRNADGTFKSEFQVFAETHSMEEIRQRARTQKDFGDWVQGQYSVEGLKQAPFKVVGAPTREATAAERAELQEFARIFTQTPSSILKPIAGIVTMAGKTYPYSTFRALVDQCAEIGLL